MTPRTPGLDPRRRREVSKAIYESYGQRSTWRSAAITEVVLAADDAHARSRGLVASGDLVPRMDVLHAAECRANHCDTCAALRARLEGAEQ